MDYFRTKVEKNKIHKFVNNINIIIKNVIFNNLDDKHYSRLLNLILIHNVNYAGSGC
uniref:Uncharacterized protein n=1 Tax=Heterorhabditis bacteriophora TaxID=37862 RepID=A0A1I7WTR1_HETBA